MPSSLPRLPIAARSSDLDQPEPREPEDPTLSWRVDDTRGPVMPLQRLIRLDPRQVVCPSALEVRVDLKRVEKLTEFAKRFGPARLPSVTVTRTVAGDFQIVEGVEVFMATKAAERHLWAWVQFAVEDQITDSSGKTTKLVRLATADDVPGAGAPKRTGIVSAKPRTQTRSSRGGTPGQGLSTSTSQTPRETPARRR